jgi:hypothetical protein
MGYSKALHECPLAAFLTPKLPILHTFYILTKAGFSDGYFSKDKSSVSRKLATIFCE